MYPEDVDPESGCRLPLPRREHLDDAGQRTYDSLADPEVAPATFARSMRHFGRRALVDLVALMGNYAGTAALLTAFDMQLDPGQPPLLPQL